MFRPTGHACLEVYFKEAEDFPHVLLAFLEAGNTLKCVPHPFPQTRNCTVALPHTASSRGARCRFGAGPGVPVVRMVGTKPSLSPARMGEAAGLAVEVVPRYAVLRHSKIAVTMEIYTEVPSAATRAALRKLGRWLGS